MKKLLMLLLVLSILLVLYGCSNSAADGSAAIVQNNTGNTPTQNTDQEQASDAEEDVFVFTANDVEIPMHAPAETILAALGEPKSYTEQTSCAFDGLDKTYFYGNFYLQTYPGTDGDYIYCIWLVDDTLTTEEGIYIGASQAEVEATYGADSFDGTNVYTIIRGNSSLTIILTDGIVSSIQYDAQIQ